MQTSSANNDLTLGSEPHLSGPLSLGVLQWVWRENRWGIRFPVPDPVFLLLTGWYLVSSALLASASHLKLNLKLQYFGHLMWTATSLEKALMLGQIEGRGSRQRQRMIWLGGINDSIDMSLSKSWEIVKDREAWLAAVHGVAKGQQDRTTKAKLWAYFLDFLCVLL